MPLESTLIFTDTLPDRVSTDLSLASTFIPSEQLQGIAQWITQIDMSLYGIESQFDADSAQISHSADVELNCTVCPINSTAETQDFSPVYGVDFI
jgi:hypothetical protein